MTNDMTRRSALRLAGGVGTLGVVGLVGGLRGPWGTRANAATTDAAADCVVTPEVTEGPYWVDTKLNRSDIRSNADGTDTQGGVPLTLTIYLKDASCGSVVSGAWIDIWHANDQGVYSDETSEGTSSKTWLRGYQVTDDTGKVTFTTVYPGWYSGRTIHIHMRVRTFDGTTTTNDYTTQLFFDESDNNAVVATTDYARGTRTRDTTNAADSIYQQEVSDGGAVLVPLTGDTTNGYAGTVVAAFIGDTPITTTDSKVSAKLLSVAASRVSKRRRHVTVTFHAGETVSAAGALALHGSIVEKSSSRSYAKGKHILTLTLPNSVGHGTGHLSLGVADASGNVRLLKHPVTIPK